MRRATRIAAAALGVFAGVGGPEHGIFEIMRGNTRPETLIFPSMGPPCDPEAVWHACEPAMSIIPNYLITGILASLVGLVTIIWSVLYLHRKRGGWGLIGLSIVLLLVGGGLVPPIIGILTGVMATRVHARIKRRSTGASRVLSQLWPWALVAFFVMLWGQFAIGFFFNDWFMRSGFLIPVVIMGLLVLSILSAVTRDVERAVGAE